MTYSSSQTFNQNTSDNLNPADNVLSLLKKNDETIKLKELSSVINEETIGHSFILSHPENGVLGSPALGDDGSQVLLGEYNRITTLLSVTNPNNIFTERFYFDLFKDSTTTADFDTLNHDCEFTVGEFLLSESVAYNTGTITKVTITLTGTNTSNISITATANGGTNWESCTDATQHIFTNKGTDLQYKLTATGTATVTEVTVRYE